MYFQFLRQKFMFSNFSEPKYIAPEVLGTFLHSNLHLSDCGSDGGGSKLKPSGPKVDVWAIGISLIELYLVCIYISHFIVNILLCVIFQRFFYFYMLQGRNIGNSSNLRQLLSKHLSYVNQSKCL